VSDASRTPSYSFSITFSNHTMKRIGSDMRKRLIILSSWVAHCSLLRFNHQLVRLNNVNTDNDWLQIIIKSPVWTAHISKFYTILLSTSKGFLELHYKYHLGKMKLRLSGNINVTCTRDKCLFSHLIIANIKLKDVNNVLMHLASKCSK